MAAKTKPAVSPASDEELRLAELAGKVDELGALEIELAPVLYKTRRAEELRAAIRAHFADCDPAEPFEARGSRFTLLAGPRGSERKVNNLRLIKAIGAKAFATIAAVTLKALDTTSLDTAAKAALVDVARTGPRPLKIFELGARQ